MKSKDLTNQKFNKLTALYRVESTKDGAAKWHCLCECGNECDIKAYYLTSGHTKSCGCERKKKTAITGSNTKLKLENKRFDNLVVLEDSGKRRGTEVMWKCKCDCGNICYVSSSDLTHQKVHSCGCQRRQSQGELKIENILKENNIQYIKEYSPNNLFSKNNGLMRFDFAILQNNQIIRLIEYDGEQHFKDKSASYWFDTLENIQQRDQEKNNWAKQHNIPLIRIPYWEKENITLNTLLENRFLQ